MTEYVEVVTRYGGHKHLALASTFTLERHRTLCMGTSSWTLQSWQDTPDHPTLSTVEIFDLPACPRCIELAPEAAPAAVTEPESYSERGFAQWKEFKDLDGTEIKVSESSLATEHALRIYCGYSWTGSWDDPIIGGTAHLSIDQVRGLRDVLTAFLKEGGYE